MNSSKSRIITGLVWTVSLIAIWEIISFFMTIVFKDPMAAKKLPFFHDIIAMFVKNADKLLSNGAITLSYAAKGFLYGGIIGFVLAVFMSLSKAVERIAMPYLLISQMIPVLGLAPIIFSMVKDFDTARVVISTYLTFFSISVNALAGFKSVPPERKDLLYSYATKKHKVYMKLMLPSCLPSLFTGLKIAAPLAVTAAIFSDTLANKNGIGQIMVASLKGDGGTMLWPSILTGAIMGILSYLIIVAVEWLAIPWNRQVKKNDEN